MCNRRPPMSTNMPGGAGAPSSVECCAGIDRGRTNSVNMPAEHRFQNVLALRMTLLLLLPRLRGFPTRSCRSSATSAGCATPPEFVSILLKSASRGPRLLSRQRQLAHLFRHGEACAAIIRQDHRCVSAVEEHIQVRADAFEAAAVAGDLVLPVNLEPEAVIRRVQLGLR